MDSDFDCQSVKTQIPAFEPVFYSKIYQISEPSEPQDPNDKNCKFPPHALQYLKLKDIPNILKIKLDNDSIIKLLNDIDEDQLETYNSLINKKSIEKTIVTPHWLSKELLINNPQVLITAWKEVNADQGDSFYTCFAYSLFMQFIIKQQSLNSLIYDILHNFQLKIVELYKDLSFSQTKFVLKHLFDNYNKNTDALLNDFYEYYNIFPEFDKVIKLYLRFCIYRYYAKCFKKDYTYILDEGSEPYPKTFVFKILSQTFDITLHIYDPPISPSANKFLSKMVNFLGKGNSNEKKVPSSNNSPLIYNDKKDSVHLFILYFQNHYHIYTNDKIQQTSNRLNNFLTFDMTNITLNNDEMCNICKEKENLKLLYQDDCNRFVICHKCLNQHIQSIMKQRVEKYCERRKYNQELYLRPIYIEDKICLRDLIISKVFTNGKSEKESYLSYLFDTYVRNCCFKCNKITGETNLKKAECGCEFHDECYKDIMIENFGHLGTEPQNLFLREKAEKDGKLEFICAKCKKVYYENIFELIPQDKLKLFMQRIKKTFMSYCMGCGEEIQTKNKHVLQFNISQLKLDGYKCKIVDDEQTPHNKFKDLYHYLCEFCVTNTIVKEQGKSLIPNCFFCKNKHFVSYQKLNHLAMSYPGKKHK